MRFHWLIISGCLFLTCLSCVLVDDSGGGSGDPIPIPDDGEWLSSALSFEMNEGRITRIEFSGFGCVGPQTAAGIPVCESLLSGPVELDAPVDLMTASFVIETFYGLHLEGTFSNQDRLEGTFTYIADNGCCDQDGNWEAVHEVLAQTEPPPACHNEVTGEEGLEIGLTSEDNVFLSIEEGGAITAVAGFQGAIMIVAGLHGEGFAVGNLTTELELIFPDTGVHGTVVAEQSAFQEQEDEGVVWLNLWLILEDESGNLLSPTKPEDIALIEGKTVHITARIHNTCGFQLDVSTIGILDYSS